MYSDQNLIDFAMYDLCFHDDLYNYKKFSSMMNKINIYILVDLCMWPTSSTSKFSWQFLVISTKTFKWFVETLVVGTNPNFVYP